MIDLVEHFKDRNLTDHQKTNLKLIEYYISGALGRKYVEFGELWLDLFYPNDGESNIYKTTGNEYLTDIAKRCGTSENLLKSLKENENE